MVRRLGSGEGPRAALAWYAVLVVLPALVFGGLLWHQLTQQHAERRAKVPVLARNAGDRLARAVRAELNALLARENEREFYLYQLDYYEESTVPGEAGKIDLRPIRSPLTNEVSEGIRAWFEVDMVALGDLLPVVLAPQPVGLTGDEAAAHTAWRLEFETFVEDVLVRPLQVGHMYHKIQGDAYFLTDSESTRRVDMDITLVALNCSADRDRECVSQNRSDLNESIGDLRNLRVLYGAFELRTKRDHLGELHVLAEREVVIDRVPDLVMLPTCFGVLETRQTLVQGFDIDPRWLLHSLPAAQAERVLGVEIELHTAGSPAPEGPDVTVEEVDLWDALGIELSNAEEERALGRLHVSSSVAEIDRSNRAQLLWLVGVTGAMIASLLLGTRLLVGSVRSSQSQARRTENFVAAVTHELRSPIAAVKLYGEMLRDGWAKDETRRQEYLERIVGESDRLDGLVDKVLTHRMLSGHAPKPEPGDLSALISNLASDLRQVGGVDRGDLELALAPGLPPASLYPEGVREIVVNLVENARKYAPVPRGGAPLRVETRLNRRGRVVLEVSDRGPGIPEAERSRVFRPFYRLGDERTRKTQGTGLGLHLVQLQARAMKARVQLLDRDGGGTTFRVTFRTLPPGTIA